MVKPMNTLELHYLMIQFLIKQDIVYAAYVHSLVFFLFGPFTEKDRCIQTQR